MSNKLPQVPTWLFTFVVASAMVAYTCLVFFPGQRSVASIRAEIRKQCRETQNASQRVAELPKVEKTLEETRAIVATWRANAPGDGEFAAYLGEVTRLAAQSGAPFKRFTPLEVERRETLCEHPIEATVEGSFAEVFDLVRQVEALPSTTWVESIELQPLRDNGENLRCEIVLKVFNENHKGSD